MFGQSRCDARGPPEGSLRQPSSAMSTYEGKHVRSRATSVYIVDLRRMLPVVAGADLGLIGIAPLCQAVTFFLFSLAPADCGRQPATSTGDLQFPYDWISLQRRSTRVSGRHHSCGAVTAGISLGKIATTYVSRFIPQRRGARVDWWCGVSADYDPSRRPTTSAFASQWY